MDPTSTWSETPWVPHMLGVLGERETPGPKTSSFIEACYRATIAGRAAGLDDSRTPWCSAAMNWGVVQAGLQGTGSLAARSWCLWGREVVAPFPGCVVILSRPPNPAHGHVGVWMAWHGDGSEILILGGNQRNAMSIMPYPSDRVIGYRIAA